MVPGSLGQPGSQPMKHRDQALEMRHAALAAEARIKARVESKVMFRPKTEAETEAFRDAARSKTRAASFTEYLNDTHAVRRCPTP